MFGLSAIWWAGFCGRFGWKVKSFELGCSGLGVVAGEAAEPESWTPDCGWGGGVNVDGIDAAAMTGFESTPGSIARVNAGAAEGPEKVTNEDGCEDVGWNVLLNGETMLPLVTLNGEVDCDVKGGLWGGPTGNVICPGLFRIAGACDHVVELPEGFADGTEKVRGLADGVTKGPITWEGLNAVGVLPEKGGADILDWPGVECKVGIGGFLGWLL